MTNTETTEQFTRLVQKINPHSVLLRVWPLVGGISAQVNALEIEKPDGYVQKMVVRQHGAADYAKNHNIAQDEYKLHHFIHTQGIKVPKPIYVDASNEIFSTPVIVIEFIEGESLFNPPNIATYVQEMAKALAQIHSITETYPDLAFLPIQHASTRECIQNRPEILDDSIGEYQIRDVLENIWPLATNNETTLLHGDYWPGNLLWKDGEITAVIDWEDAQVGDPLGDLGNSRMEILWSLGEEAMNQFTDYYQSLMPHIDFSQQPFWDLAASIRSVAFILDEIAESKEHEQTLRDQHRWFVNQAMENLKL